MSAYPFEQHYRHFSSGVNAPGEVAGIHGWIGIAANEIRAGLLEALEERSGPGMLRVFVDSGAFSEVAFGPGGVTVVEEITHTEWMRRFQAYQVIAARFGPRAFLVTPDQVGNQAVTLERLQRYSHIMAALVFAHRARLIVPVQKGSLSMVDFFTQCLLALKLPLADRVGDPVWPIAGIPMKKDATTIAELEEFAAQLPNGAHFHLLGIGPESKRYPLAIAAIRKGNPDAEITSDSNTIRRLVGRTNGRGGGPRALTLAQDKARAEGLKGSDLKAAALSAVGWGQHRAERLKAYAMGWSDPELEGERPGLDDQLPTVFQRSLELGELA